MRKLKRFQHVIEKETGILTCLTPTKNIVISINAYNAINGKLHIGQDNKPLYLLYSETVPINDKKNQDLPPGLILLKNFVTEEEESILLSCIKWDESDSGNLKHRKVKHYGYEFRYDINNVDKNVPLLAEIPDECENILNRFRKNNEQFENFKPDQLTINEYKPGQGIPPHVDTHSAFEDPLLSLSLGASVNMEFRNNNDNHISVLLPRRSLLIMSGESRYAWTHGITPRKFDIVPSDQGLTVLERGLRTSFTFRKVLKGECNCKYTENCDSYLKLNSEIEIKLAEELESTHVHKVYEEIATHFSDTRHKPWPNVLDFINSLPVGSVMIDVGCGNGKYLGHNKNLFEIGCDRSFNLIEICNTRGFEVFNCNCLQIPLKNDIADGIISIAVIHHLANEDRRIQAVKEIIRVLTIGGRALIYVWAKDQQKHKKSSYLKQDRKNRKDVPDTQDGHSNEIVNIGYDVSLPVHVNRTQFQHQDVLVPWKLKQSTVQTETKIEQTNSNMFLRFYHVFEEGELEKMCGKIKNCLVIKSYYDQGNWCVILEKV
ncbi:uncharacterized protein CBL_01232 [Carabus blaptoides fortunei]